MIQNSKVIFLFKSRDSTDLLRFYFILFSRIHNNIHLNGHFISYSFDRMTAQINENTAHSITKYQNLIIVKFIECQNK